MQIFERLLGIRALPFTRYLPASAQMEQGLSAHGPPTLSGAILQIPSSPWKLPARPPGRITRLV